MPLSGQVLDDFSDNDLTANPLWVGNLDHFQVESGALKLRAPAAQSSSYVFTSNALIVGSAWECRVLLAFNPSSSNFCRMYLIADNADPAAAVNGYYVQVGSQSDDVCLFRQRGSVHEKLINGPDGLLNSDSTEVTIRVIRSSTGSWELLLRTTDNPEFQSQGVAPDSGPDITANYAGIQCVYTSTRADKFSFDDFSITPIDDRIPPYVTQAQVKSSNELELIFSEPLLKAVAENVLNYESDMGHPASAKQNEVNPSAVSLSFDADFKPWIEYQLVISNVADLAGNAIQRDTISFVHRTVSNHRSRDIVITEVLSDPSPTVGLPEGEFIEILNITDHPVDLSGWIIRDASSSGSLPDGEILNAGAYAILTAGGQAGAFSGLGRVIEVSSFPSLNNNGDDVVLKATNGQTIDSIRFESSWHSESGKDGGGWSLEIIDPRNPCGGRANWGSSEHNMGGTPGTVNSIDDVKPDLSGPKLILAKGLYPDTVVLMFDETLHHEVAASASFVFSPAKDPVDVTLNKQRNSISLRINPEMVSGEVLKVTVDGVVDCSGNPLIAGSRTATVVSPEPADSLDVVINEILFNPRSNSVDFIEVFNRSEKYIDMTGWAFGNPGPDGVENINQIKMEFSVLAPGQYAAITEDRQIVLSDYPLAPAERIFTSKTPPLNDDAGSVAVLDRGGKIIDAMHYSDNMHSIFLKDTEGVSLERISAGESATNANNWKSAASASGYATPGYQNSNFRDGMGTGDGIILQPEIFAPHSTDRNFTIIEYRFDTGGFIGTISIFDQRGRCVKKVAENALLGASGFFRWDGDRDDGTKASMGNYMVRVELFNSQGVVKVIAKRVAVASQF